MTDLTPNHPAVEAAARSAYERAWCGENEPWSEVDDLERDEWRADEAHSLSAALPHLTADDLPARLVRDIQVRTIRATARAATYDDWIHHYNHHRPHTATQGHPPITRLTNLPDQYT